MEAQERGEVDAEVDPILVSNAIFGLVNWIYTWYNPKGSITPDYLGELYAEVAVAGITSPNMPKPPPTVRRTTRAKRA